MRKGTWLLLFSCGLSMCVTAFSADVNLELLPDPNLLSKGPGVHIMPLEEIYRDQPQEKVKAMIEASLNFQDYIFVEDPSEITNFLESGKHPQMTYFSTNAVQEYTGLRQNLSLLKLGFPVKDFKLPNDVKIIGYAPSGSLKETGWTGFSVVFDSNHYGKCNYRVNNVELSKAAVYIAEEYVEYLINKKPSQYSVIGHQDYGFKYSLDWYDNDYFREIECATIDFDPAMKEKLIKLTTWLDDSFPAPK